MQHISQKRGVRRATLLLAGIMALGTVGCIGIGGTQHYDSKTPTLGRQLTDLKAARDTGAINQAEYDQAKAKLLSSVQ